MPQSRPDIPLVLTTTLGEEELKFRTMNAREELGRLFEFEILAKAEAADIDGNSLLGTPASVSLILPDNSKRHFHGLVCAVSLTGPLEDGVGYRLILRPWLWLLTRRTDSRIFQDKTLKQIAEAVFEPFSNDFDFKQLQGELPKYEYCVQYRETDFDFISRLLEKEGLYYFFEHGDGKHTMVIVNAKGSHENAPVAHEFRYRPTADRALDFEPVTEWAGERGLQSGSWALTDYNFKDPTTSLMVDDMSAVDKASAKLEVYDYPGDYLVKGDGERYVKLRSEAGDTQHTRVRGAGSIRTLACGYLFKLIEHPDDAENVSHLALSTQIEMGYSGYESGAGDDYFRCRFTAAPANVQFRPQRLTPRARVGGPHTAVVVGPAGDEIFVDEYGRVKVQFHWDRLGENNEDSSCFVRVAQASAGKGFGAVWLPRIGHEVVVQFLEGDPDRPLITGAVYNAVNMPPYVLPDHKTVSTLKSRSTKTGGANDFNELRFEDEKGKEYILFHAQKDRLEFVEQTLRSHIGIDEHRTVKKDRREKIEGEHHLQVLKDVRHQFEGKSSLKVIGDMLIESDGQHSLKMKGDITAKSDASYSIKAASDMHVKVDSSIGMEAGMNVHLKAGMNVVIEAGAQLTLKAGACFVVLGPDGVSISGPTVKVNSGGAAGSGGGASPVAPTAPIKPEDPELPVDPLPHH